MTEADQHQPDADDPKQRIKDAVSRVKDAAGSINVAGRANISSAVNTGGGGRTAVSKRQRIRVRQDGKEATVDERSTSSGGS